VGILGFGPIGMSVMLAAKAMGASAFYVTDKIDSRLSIASGEGATYTGNPLKKNIVGKILQKEPLGLDVVFECCGQQEAVDQAIDLLRPGGKLMVVGIPEFNNWSVNAEKTRRNELTLFFVRRQVDCVQTSLDLMKSGEINIDNMVTHRFLFKRTKEAFDLVADYKDGVMKALIGF
jgi:L-iditol 2-dehydrogenase